MPRDLKILDRQVFASGAMVFEMGTEGNRAYIIESGKVEVFIRDSEGEIVEISRLGPGALIGEIALMDRGRRIANVRTVEPTILITVSSFDFRDAIMRSNTLKKNIAMKATRRLKETLDTIESQKQPDKIKSRAQKQEITYIMETIQSTLTRVQKKVEQDLAYPK